VHDIRSEPDRAFFLPVPRFWELLAGVALAVAPRVDGLRALAVRVPSYVRVAAALAGLAAIAWVCFAIRDVRAFPGLWALVPVAGTAAVIASGPDTWVHRRVLGNPMRPYGDRSRFVATVKQKAPTEMPDEWGGNFTPLDVTLGIITPSALHFEVCRGGVPEIDPKGHRLLIHGMVDRPVILTMEEIRRLPSASRILFLECQGNSLTEWRTPTGKSVESTHGQTSCSEWTGVPLSLLLREAGVQKKATWILAEGDSDRLCVGQNEVSCFSIFRKVLSHDHVAASTKRSHVGNFEKPLAHVNIFAPKKLKRFGVDYKTLHAIYHRSSGRI